MASASASVSSIAADAPPQLQQRLAQISDSIAAPAQDAQAAAPYTVAMLGRTQAGKSTLMAALTGAPEDAIGWPGRQRHTREVAARVMLDLPDVELLDTPGVGAHDGQEDRELALAQLDRAQLVVWVAPNDGFQEDTAESLRLVATMGKPVIVVLNSKADLRHDINLTEFLEDPTSMLAAAEGHLQAIRRHLRRAGAQPLAEVVLHAQAAFFGLRRSEHAPALTAAQRDALVHASRVGALVEVLRDEARSEPRRALAAAHPARLRAGTASNDLRHAAAELQVLAQLTGDKHERVRKDSANTVDDAEARMLAAVRGEVSRRRSWTDQLSLEQIRKEAGSLWRQQQEDLHKAVEAQLHQESRRLQERLDRVLQDVEEEFARIQYDGFEPPDTTEAWIRKIVKGGGRLATGWAGFKAGAAIGSALTPGVGSVVGAVVGLAVGAFGDSLVKGVANLFRSKAEILGRASAKLRSQTDGVLDTRQADYETTVRRQMSQVRADLQRRDDAVAARVARLWRAAETLIDAADRIDAGTAAFDTDTAAGLLGAAGRPVERRLICDAYRYPGHGFVIRVQDPAFSNLVLHPAATPEPVVPVSPSRACPAADVAQVLLGLTDAGFTVDGRSGAVEAVVGGTVQSQGQMDAWQAMSSRMAGSPVTIRADVVPSAWGARDSGLGDRLGDEAMAA